jgi:hypothetical protein
MVTPQMGGNVKIALAMRSDWMGKSQPICCAESFFCLIVAHTMQGQKMMKLPVKDFNPKPNDYSRGNNDHASS